MSITEKYKKENKYHNSIDQRELLTLYVYILVFSAVVIILDNVLYAAFFHVILWIFIGNVTH